MITNDAHHAHHDPEPRWPWLSSVLTVAAVLGLGGCLDVDEASPFDDIEGDSDGAEDDEAIEFRALQDTCGDDPPGGGPGGGPPLCAQQCHDTYHGTCLPTAATELRTNCRQAVEGDLGYNCDEEWILAPGDIPCYQKVNKCIESGYMFPEPLDAYEDQVADCQDDRIDCLAQC